MKVSDFIADFVFCRGVRHVFELSGGMIAHLLDSIHRDGRVELVSMRHEQAAAFAAEGYARISGVPGIAMATSGPGATNLLTGVGSCYFDSTPAVFITGQVNRYEQKGDRAIRQLGFQELDIVSMVKPITKAAWRVDSPERVAEVLDCAFRTALTGRPGPVLVDVPMDVQRAEIEPLPPSEPSAVGHRPVQTGALLTALRSAQRPLILAGGGIRSSRTIDAFRRTVRLLQVPVVHSLMAVDVLPASDPLRVGMIGSYGNRWANIALSRCDCLLVVGSRLDVRQTGADTESFKAGRTIWHIDCEPGEVNNRVRGCQAIISELPAFFDAVAGSFESQPEWLAELSHLRRQWPDTAELKGISGINPNVFMHHLAAASLDAAAYVVDVGQHQMWAAQSLDIAPEQRFITSGGMGSMGFGLPAAIGALIYTGKPVVIIAGDGGFQCNIQELETIVNRKLPAKIVVLNNGCHGMVRQFQETYFEGRYPSTMWGYSAPDFAKVAAGYGIPACTVNAPSEVPSAVAWLWTDRGAALLQVMIDPLANAYPKVAFGRPIDQMEPFTRPKDIEST
jgi:acetolactate synthase-1/2/3 large subunit